MNSALLWWVLINNQPDDGSVLHKDIIENVSAVCTLPPHNFEECIQKYSISPVVLKIEYNNLVYIMRDDKYRDIKCSMPINTPLYESVGSIKCWYL